MISGDGTTSLAADTTRKVALDFLDKPFESTERLLVTLRNVLERSRLKDENRSLKQAIEIFTV